MAKAFSLVSWNVEHFKNADARADRVVGLLAQQNPTVFALYEVEGKEVFDAITNKMPGYVIHVTEGPQAQEILVGVRNNVTAFFTQKLEFQSGVSLLRPGAVLTVTIDGKHYPILFLHTKSGNDPRGLGLRDDMLVRACDFRDTLDKAAVANGKANYMFLGDLNTMGMKYRHVPARNIPVADEMVKLAEVAKRKRMRILKKDEAATWWNGSASSMPPSDLDHVIAADHLKFRLFNGAEVTVNGWPKESTTAKKDEWIKRHSDHGLLKLEVQKV